VTEGQRAPKPAALLKTTNDRPRFTPTAEIEDIIKANQEILMSSLQDSAPEFALKQCSIIVTLRTLETVGMLL
jgi:hypothetical protein